MSAGVYDLKLEQGATYRRVFKLSKGGVPLVLTGATARAQCRPKLGSTVVLFEVSTENGGLTVDGAQGWITLHIDEAVTAAFTFKSAVWDLKYRLGNDDVRLLKGTVTVDPAVTVDPVVIP